MTKHELQKLRKNLPKGSREVLARQFNCSIGHINNVLTGLRENEPIILAAVNLVSEHKRNIQEAEKFIETL